MSDQRALASHAHNQFVGRSLKMNGPVKQDTYSDTPVARESAARHRTPGDHTNAQVFTHGGRQQFAVSVLCCRMDLLF